jgi:hypothetical protein
VKCIINNCSKKYKNYIENTIQLPPIPASILGISNIVVENAEITETNEFIITVRSTEKEIHYPKCGNVTTWIYSNDKA